MTRVLSFLIPAFLLLHAGCASNQREESKETEVDRLWRQGYGYNNPNPERIKNGLPPVNLDGTVHERD